MNSFELAMKFRRLLQDEGYLVEADVAQCTACGKPKISHPGQIGSARAGLEKLTLQDGCDRFEYLPFHVMDGKGKLHSFGTTHETKKGE